MYSDLNIDLLLTDARLDIVAERIDLAIRLGPLEDSTLIVQKLMSTKYSVCASPDYLKRVELNQPQDITRHNCLLFPLAGFRTRWIFKSDLQEIFTVPVKGRTIISNAMGLKECTIAGMGLALLPNWLIGRDLEAGKLIEILSDYEVTATDFDTSAWLVYPSRNYVPLKVRVFIDFLQQHLSDKYPQ